MSWKTAADFTLRALFFVAAPSLLVFAAAFFPITGALVQMALALVVFFAGEAVRNLVSRSKLAAILFSTQLAFEAYYREHPPRPFLYYVFYPLLFPYWLFVKQARREFLLFKGYTLASFALLVIGLAVQFVRNFPPELGLRHFWPIAAGTFAVETFVVLALLMPIATTVVHYHRLRARKSLVALLLIGIASSGLAVARLERKRDPVVSFATRERARMRAQAAPRKAQAAYAKALKSAMTSIPRAKDDLDADGKVEGVPLEVARGELQSFFKNDESYAFDLWYSQAHGTLPVLVLYSETRGKTLWAAIDARGQPISKTAMLPKNAFRAMKNAAD